MSISTKKGDTGITMLVGGRRVSKADVRVEAYGNVDELSSTMGFARSICDIQRISERTAAIQRDLFVLSGALATPAEEEVKTTSVVTQDMVDELTRQVHEIESIDGILGDWALPGEHPVSAAYDVARTVCRRAERAVVRLANQSMVQPLVVKYLNRLSDLLWLYGRLVEKEAGIDSRLRDGDNKGPSWSRAW